MQLTRLIAILISWFMTLTTHAQSGDGDPCFNAVVRERDQYGRVIFFFGDSISRGYGLGNFPDLFKEAEAQKHPLWALRSPASTINFILSGKDIAFMKKCDVSKKQKLLAVYAGGSGLPRIQSAKEISQLISDYYLKKIILPGDSIVFEDAGDHHGDPDQFEAALQLLLDQHQKLKGVRILVATTPDLMTDQRRVELMPENFHWEAPLKTSKSKQPRSLNQVYRETAQRYGTKSTEVRLLEYHKAVSETSKSLASKQVSLMHEDQIHPNIFGQLIFSTLVLSQEQDVKVPQEPPAVLLKLVRQNIERLSKTGVRDASTAETAVKASYKVRQ